MSASREKKLRQELANSGHVDPKAVREAEQRAKEKRSAIVYGVVIGVFVVAFAAMMIWRSNIIQKKATAMTIDGEAYTAAEVNFYYRNVYLSFMNTASQYASLLGIDTNASMKTQTVSATASSLVAMMGLPAVEEGTVWHDYFLNQAVNQMSYVQNALKAAEAEGYTFPEAVQIQHDMNIDSLTTSAAANNVSVDEFLAANFSTNMTQEIYSEHLLRLLKFDVYSAEYVGSLEYTDDELEAIYAENPNLYDFVNYEVASFTGTVEATTDESGNKVEPTEAETEAAKKAAKEKADALLAAYKAGGELEAPAKEAEATYTANDHGAYYDDDALSTWLFDKTRKAGDCAVVEDGSTYYVVVFHDRYREEYNTIDVRHILIQPETGTKASTDEGYEEEQAKLLADAKAKAEEILNEWKAGEATAVSFAELALEHSTDPGSKYDGGLYTNVTKGQMVETFDAWCFDTSRKEGDTGIVETDYGYHIMYFSGENQPYWQLQITNPLIAEEYNAWLDDMMSEAVVEQHSFGMSFVG